MADLQRGIARERARLAGKPFVVLMTCRDFDYDGLTNKLALLDGFTDQAVAIQYAQAQAVATLAQALTEPPVYERYPWRLVEDSAVPRSFLRHPSATVTSVFAKRLEVAPEAPPGLRYDRKEFEFDVLHVTTAEIVGGELFCFQDVEQAWISHLIERGRV